MLIIFERVLSNPEEKTKLALNPACILAVSPIFNDQTEISVSIGHNLKTYAVRENFETVIEHVNTALANFSGDGRQ